MKLVNYDKMKNESLDIDREKEARKQQLVSSYKKYANLSDNDAIDMNNLDDWALNEACFQNNVSKENLLNELRNQLSIQ